MKRRAARTDSNQTEIVEALRKCGALVLSLAALGKGCPDVLTYFKGRLLMLEIKDGNKSPSRRKLTSDQERFHALWSGAIVIVNSVDEALRAIGVRSE
jgi:Holliday junction resolvase